MRPSLTARSFASRWFESSVVMRSLCRMRSAGFVAFIGRLEAEGYPSGKVIHIFPGRILVKERAREKMRIVGRPSQVPLKPPLDLGRRLRPDITRASGDTCARDVLPDVVNAVVGALAPEKVAIGGERERTGRMQ